MQKAIAATFPFIMSRSKSRTNLKTVKFLMLGLLLCFIVAYVMQSNIYARETYLIKSFETNITNLTNENNALEIKFSSANSLNNLGNFVKNSVFEKTGSIEYIRILEDTAVAK